jgi:hypothetical protein
MDLQNIIVLIVTIVLVFFAIKYITKIVFKLLILIVIVLGGLIVYQQLSDTNMIDNVESLYCSEGKETNIKCECFVIPILDDLNSRFSLEEIENIKSQKIRSNTEFLKSFTNVEQDIKVCFKEKNESIGVFLWIQKIQLFFKNIFS